MSPQHGAGVNGTHAWRHQFAAMAGGDDDVAIGNLARPRLAAQLQYRFRQAGEIAQMIAGQKPAGGVDRNAAPRRDMAGFDEGAALAFRAEAIILDLKQHLGGEAVVELRAIDVAKFDSGLGKGLRSEER